MNAQPTSRHLFVGTSVSVIVNHLFSTAGNLEGHIPSGLISPLDLINNRQRIFEFEHLRNEYSTDGASLRIDLPTTHGSCKVIVRRKPEGAGRAKVDELVRMLFLVRAFAVA